MKTNNKFLSIFILLVFVSVQLVSPQPVGAARSIFGSTLGAVDSPVQSAQAVSSNAPQATAADCLAPANEIVAENCLTGNPSSEWDVSGVGDTSI